MVDEEGDARQYEAVVKEEEQYSISPIQERLVRIWREVLGVSGIGIHDDFFDLGGNSIYGAQILTRVARDFNVELSIDTVFDAPTIAQFADAIDSALRGTYI